MMTCVEIMDIVLDFKLSLVMFCMITRNAVCSKQKILLYL